MQSNKLTALKVVRKHFSLLFRYVRWNCCQTVITTPQMLGFTHINYIIVSQIHPIWFTYKEKQIRLKVVQYTQMKKK